MSIIKNKSSAPRDKVKISKNESTIEDGALVPKDCQIDNKKVDWFFLIDVFTKTSWLFSIFQL